MKLSVFLLIFSFNLYAGTNWFLAKETYELQKIGDDGFLSTSCLKTCELKKRIEDQKSALKSFTPARGSDPASHLCKLAHGKVVFMREDKSRREDAFCLYKKDIISLSLLL